MSNRCDRRIREGFDICNLPGLGDRHCSLTPTHSPLPDTNIALHTVMSYNILGVKVLNEYIALATFASYGALGYSMSGGSKDAKPSASGSSASTPSPPLNAANS